MRPVATELNTEKLKVPEKRLRGLTEWLEQEIAGATAARAPLEETWRELLRLYEGVPKKEIRNTPIVNAPNIEVTIGAIAVDSVNAQVLDLVYSASPPITVRAVNAGNVTGARALQRFVDWIAHNEIDMRRASEQCFMDTIQLGTGVYYIPWMETMRKTRVKKITSANPMIRCVPPEDFLVPGGSDADDLQEARWCAMRYYLFSAELEARKQDNGWDIDGAAPIGAMSWVRARREQLGRTMSGDKTEAGRLYDCWDIYCYYDLDGDGYAEDLLVTFNQAGRKIMKIRYNPYDHRPFEASRYQIRPHMFYGVGVMEMMKPFQEGATELYNEWVTNLKIANSRVWKAKEGVIPESMEIWPNKVISMPNPESDLLPEQLGDTYPSAPTALATTIGFAQQRVGVNELSGEQSGKLLGSRTPGITALSAMQQINKRFTPAFDAMRFATSGAIRQALYRYQERLLAGDAGVERKIVELLGAEDALSCIEVLKNPDFDRQMVVELTAASATVNRDADKQNLVMLATQILAPYYQRCIELTMMASNPQIPPQVQEVTIKVANAMSEGIDMIIRTFDQVRDPSLLAVDLRAVLSSMQGNSNPLEALLAAAGQAQQGQPGQGPAVAGAPPVPGPAPVAPPHPLANIGAPSDEGS